MAKRKAPQRGPKKARAVRKQPQATAQPEGWEERRDAFLADYRALCQKHGIIIVVGFDEVCVAWTELQPASPGGIDNHIRGLLDHDSEDGWTCSYLVLPGPSAE